VVQAYNPSYARGRDAEDGGLRLAQAEKFLQILFLPIEAERMCHLSYTGSGNKRIVVQAGQCINARPS
jgi:hypothetical protein